jgi:hypothetical protein
MTRYKTIDIDNRDSSEMYNYMEARIEALQRRVSQLQEENKTLRSQDSKHAQPSLWQMRTLVEGCA